MTKLIGIAGRKRAGKDTAADALPDFQSVAFAAPMKIMLAELLRYQGATEDMIHRMLHGDLKETPSELLGGKTPRFAMQSIGGEWGRSQMGEDFWRDIGLNRARMLMGVGHDVVITDVRHHNENEGIQALGGRTIRIERPDRPSDPSDNHGSEIDIDDLGVDVTIVNGATIPELHEAVKGFVG